MNHVEIFKNPEFGSIRVVEIGGEPWLVGKDVALALGYKNPQEAIRDHVDTEDKGVSEILTPGGGKSSPLSTSPACILWCCPASSPKQSSSAGGLRLRCCPLSASTGPT